MSEVLKSVGLDIGTTSTQMILSELTIENRASGFSVPEMVVTDRKILYRSPVHFTPLLDESRMDAPALRGLVEAEYRRAGITRRDVDTGAVVITGESSRKENARAVLEALGELAGDFVAAAAGPELESLLAARGSGAAAYARDTGKTLLHIDIGGGTSNLCLFREGRAVQTGCLNVGGRLIKVDGQGRIRYVSPVLQGLCDLKPGDKADPAGIREVAEILTQALEMAAGLRQPAPLLEKLTTREVGRPWIPPEEAVVLSFSGGVADCIEKEEADSFRFGDMGPQLGQAIRHSRLCQGAYLLGRETIRATVIGAGCHSAQLSGSTVFYRDVAFPVKNLPVVEIQDLNSIAERLTRAEGAAVLTFPGEKKADYARVKALAEAIVRQGQPPFMVCLEQDMAKALGQALAVRLPPGSPILCIDSVRAEEGSYLDIGAPLRHCLPVVVKTLIFSER